MNKIDNFFEVFPWNKNFETGIELIDEQHKVIITLINELAWTISNEDHIEINRIYNQLTEYAEFHFESEEAIWFEYLENDTWFSSHQLSHSSFLPKALELKDKKTDQFQSEIAESIILFLVRWLAFHILDHDKRIAFFIEFINEGMSMDEAKIAVDKKMGGSLRMIIETVMNMYDTLSSRTLSLIRERNQRYKVEKELHLANIKLREANSRLESLSITDELTGLHNRRHFNSVFSRELKRAKRNRIYQTLILVDIDLFKKINDNYGHSEGDKILIQAAHALRELCKRPSDYVFRLGGEEFCVIASNMSYQEVLQFSEMIRTHVENLKIPNDYSSISKYLTVSIGSYVGMPKKNETTDYFMSIADKNLYQAKAEGRNKVVVTE